MVWALYPETNQRTLEEMNLVFASDSIWVWEAEKNYAILKEENPDLVRAAQRGKSVSSAVDLEHASAGGRRPSLAVSGEKRKPSLVPGAQRTTSGGGVSTASTVNGTEKVRASHK